MQTLDQIVTKLRHQPKLSRDQLYVAVSRVQEQALVSTPKEAFDKIAVGLGFMDWGALWRELTSQGFVHYRPLI